VVGKNLVFRLDKKGGKWENIKRSDMIIYNLNIKEDLLDEQG
jgi:hypothetical protein